MHLNLDFPSQIKRKMKTTHYLLVRARSKGHSPKLVVWSAVPKNVFNLDSGIPLSGIHCSSSLLVWGVLSKTLSGLPLRDIRHADVFV